MGIPVLILGMFWGWASTGESWFSSTLSQQHSEAGCAKILFIFPIYFPLDHFTAPNKIQVFLEMFFSWWCREPRASKAAGIPVGFNNLLPNQLLGLHMNPEFVSLISAGIGPSFANSSSSSFSFDHCSVFYPRNSCAACKSLGRADLGIFSVVLL